MSGQGSEEMNGWTYGVVASNERSPAMLDPTYICRTHISLRNHDVGALGASCGHREHASERVEDGRDSPRPAASLSEQLAYK